MAGMLRNCWRSLRLLPLKPNHVKPIINDANKWGPIEAIGGRHLYTDCFLGVDNFVESRQKLETQFGHMREKFFERMQQYVVSEDSDKLVFTEDLKNVTILTNDKDEEIQLLINMIRKFSLQNKDLRFGAYVFGPVVMRLLHLLKKSDVALDLIKDPQCTGFFEQMTSYLIAMDLLYVETRYQEVLELYNLMASKGNFETRYPRDIIVLVLASCYKINTPESFQVAKDLVKNARSVGAIIIRRAVAFFTALSLKQKDPNCAFEALALTNNGHVSVKNLRIMALIDMKRLEDALFLVRTIISEDVPNRYSQQILPQTIKTLEEALKKSNDKETAVEAAQIFRSLNEGNHILESTIEKILDEPIQGMNKNPDQQYDGQRKIGFNRRQSGYTHRKALQASQGYQRQGLDDLD